MERRGEPWRFFRLEIYSGFSVSLRRSGFYREARELAEDVYRRYQVLAGDEHRATLIAATNLICDRHVTDDLADAQQLGEQTVLAWEKIAGALHPNTLATRANLAVVLRTRGNPDAARQMTNLASDLAAVGAVWEARELGERTLAVSRVVRGSDHPATLAVAANLSLELRATADDTAARDLRQQTMTAYENRLSMEHPQARRAQMQGRVNVDIEPTSPL